MAKEMKTLNGYEVVDAKAREDIAALQASGGESSSNGSWHQVLSNQVPDELNTNSISVYHAKVILSWVNDNYDYTDNSSSAYFRETFDISECNFPINLVEKSGTASNIYFGYSGYLESHVSFKWYQGQLWAYDNDNNTDLSSNIAGVWYWY